MSSKTTFLRLLASLACVCFGEVSGFSQTVANSSFETPAVGSYSYSPVGSSWTFTNKAGIQRNGSAYSGTATVAPDGVQTAFVQSMNSTLGTMSQSVSLGAGSYTISFQTARRVGSVQPILVSVDGTAIGTYTPASTSFALITTASFNVAAGSHTIAFAATDSVGDKTSFIDLVSISGGGGGGQPPAAPTGLTATAGNAQVSLSWTSSSGATTYNVYRGTSAGAQSATPIATGLSATTYSDTGLINGTAYYYRVRAVNSFGTSSDSNEATGTPSAGSGGGSGAFLNSSFETPTVATYSYTPAGSNWTFVNKAGIQRNGSAYSGSSTVAPGGSQTAFLQSLNGTLGSMSQSVNFSAGTYSISFQAARRYSSIQPIQVSVDGASIGTYTPASNNFALITTASFSVSAGTHTILFAATDNVGDKTSFIDLVNIGGGSGGQPPVAPAGLTATPGNSQVALNWTASSGAASYEIYRGTAPSSQSATPIATGIATNNYTNTGLNNGTTYYYKIKAVNAFGSSPYSNEASAAPTSGGGGGGPIKIMPLGDSITHGFTIPGGYRIPLSVSLNNASIPFDYVGTLSNGPVTLADKNHEGHSGWRIDEIATGIAQSGWIATYQPDIVLLKIGGNDIVQNKPDTDPHPFSSSPQRLMALIDQIHAIKPDAMILVTNHINMSANYTARIQWYNAQIQPLIQAKINAGENVRFVDCNTGSLVAETVDGVHPNEAGYAKIAAKWFAAIQSYLAE